MDKIRPLYDRVLVQRSEEHEEKTAGGIIIPDAAKEKAHMGKVIAVGQGHRTETGSFLPLQVKVGDTVFFTKYSGSDVPGVASAKTGAGENLLILREDDILGIVEK